MSSLILCSSFYREEILPNIYPKVTDNSRVMVVNNKTFPHADIFPIEVFPDFLNILSPSEPLDIVFLSSISSLCKTREESPWLCEIYCINSHLSY